jgi:hypothetical protein
MRIGVFGDSFANSKVSGDIWWKYLNSEYNHIVECFGENGSSLSFSARKIIKTYKNYDLVIWCTTSSNRLTIWHRDFFKETAVHITGRHHRTDSDAEIQLKINIAEQYLNQVFDWGDGEFVGQCIIRTIQSTIPNLLIIPSFATPLYDDAKTDKFNLFDLCIKESSTYFPINCDVAKIQDEYIDKRIGHFTTQTHQTLAKLIAESLTPGIFETEYSNFSPPVELFENIFIKK